MSALDVLRQIKQARRAAGGAQKTVEWGNADYINEVGIENLTRRELRNHMEARDLETIGTRLELLDRLRTSIADEQLHKFAYKETQDTEFLIQAELEERGSVYVVGANDKGQLGLGDVEPRTKFTVINQLRGVGVNNIAAGADICFGVTDEHDVYVWGGGGSGKTGIKPKKGVTQSTVVNWMEPTLIRDLIGEEVFQLSIGSSHCIAIGKGGDCFVWGDGDSGQLGLGDFQNRIGVSINNSFPAVVAAAAGANHSLVMTSAGRIYAWGHGANGRLGLGNCERIGAPESESMHFPIPAPIETLEAVRQISCGADHCIAYGPSGVWAWGSGAGGRLGLGDNKDRIGPTLIPKLRGRNVLAVSASSWYSAAIIAHPPMLGGGWVYTWGSGFHGQLAQGARTVCTTPEVVEYFMRVHMLVRFISTGARHCAVLTKEGELYTWGSNNHGCLGRMIDEKDVKYTAIPGHCGGFGAIVTRIGRGFPRYVACGTEYTVVCTNPYEGPDLTVAQKLMEEASIREQEALIKRKAQEGGGIDDDD